MDNRAIGVFDSGLGGLTTVKELRRLLPYENIVYLGDTGRVPYGTRGRETIQKYAMQDMAFLQSHNVKMIIAACGTASSAITSEMTSHLGVPFSGVVLPAAQAACASSISGRIGVIGTTATVRSGAYGRAVRGINPDARVFGSACPLFVPLVENGFIQPDNEITIKVARIYLEPIIKFETDTLILGCTHYPIISAIISKAMGDQVTLIDSGRETAVYAARLLKDQQLLASGGQEGRNAFYVSDSVDGFNQIADIFLGREMNHSACRINIEEY